MASNIDIQKLERTLSVLEELFLSKDFRGIEQFTEGVRLSASEIKSAISQYPDELSGFDRASLDVIRLAEAHSPRWSINIRFKTRTGGSDLTLSLLMQDRRLKSDLYKTEIVDIHVL